MNLIQGMIERPTVSIDIEATGLSITRDRIIQLGMVFYLPGVEEAKEVNLFFNPSMTMPQSVIEVHGITNEFLENKPSFSEFANDIIALLGERDLIGYNLLKFDIPILHESLARCEKQWDWKKHRIIDASQIFRLKEPRDLSAAVRKFCGREHDSAHSAIGDARATADVLAGQLLNYPDLGSMKFDELAKFCQPEEQLDAAGKIIIGKDGRPAFSFGERTRGIAVEDDYRSSGPGRSFAEWIIRSDFPEDTKSVLCRLIDSYRQEGA